MRSVQGLNHVSSLALVLAAFTFSCAPSAGGGIATHTPDGGSSSEAPHADKLPPVVDATPSESSSFAASSNALAMDMYSRLSSKGDNLAFSPASIETAFTMTWAGAKGPTAAEMQRVLHLGSNREEALASASRVVLGYEKPHAGYELAFADKLFGDAAYRFDPGFIALSKDTFGAPLETVDFVHATEKSRLAINGFVAASTHDKIKDLLPEGALHQDTALVLVNAVYMKAAWQQPFDPSETSSLPFTHGGKQASVETMHEHGSFGYTETHDAQLVDLPYQGGDLAMTIILPKDKDGLATVESSLEAKGGFDRLVASTKPTDVRISLPKFTVGMDDALPLKSLFEDLGMKLAFDGSQADFSGMSTSDRPIHIADAYHKAFVAVAEKGTEAAAATAVVGDARAAIAVPPETGVVFNADHPFFYAIRDVHTNLILFVGRVSDPHA